MLQKNPLQNPKAFLRSFLFWIFSAVATVVGVTCEKNLAFAQADPPWPPGSYYSSPMAGSCATSSLIDFPWGMCGAGSPSSSLGQIIYPGCPAECCCCEYTGTTLNAAGDPVSVAGSTCLAKVAGDCPTGCCPANTTRCGTGTSPACCDVSTDICVYSPPSTGETVPPSGTFGCCDKKKVCDLNSDGIPETCCGGGDTCVGGHTCSSCAASTICPDPVAPGPDGRPHAKDGCCETGYSCRQRETGGGTVRECLKNAAQQLLLKK